jgi:hypothetical protein
MTIGTRQGCSIPREKCGARIEREVHGSKIGSSTARVECAQVREHSTARVECAPMREHSTAPLNARRFARARCRHPRGPGGERAAHEARATRARSEVDHARSELDMRRTPDHCGTAARSIRTGRPFTSHLPRGRLAAARGRHALALRVPRNRGASALGSTRTGARARRARHAVGHRSANSCAAHASRQAALRNPGPLVRCEAGDSPPLPRYLAL